MLEQLEKELYQEQIKKVESTFKKEIDKLNKQRNKVMKDLKE